MQRHREKAEGCLFTSCYIQQQQIPSSLSCFRRDTWPRAVTSSPDKFPKNGCFFDARSAAAVPAGGAVLFITRAPIYSIIRGGVIICSCFKEFIETGLFCKRPPQVLHRRISRLCIFYMESNERSLVISEGSNALFDFICRLYLWPLFNCVPAKKDSAAGFTKSS